MTCLIVQLIRLGEELLCIGKHLDGPNLTDKQNSLQNTIQLPLSSQPVYSANFVHLHYYSHLPDDRTSLKEDKVNTTVP